MNTLKNPSWWNQEHETAWERVGSALRRDWDQTKHDFGGDQPDTNQGVIDTVQQAAGSQPIPPRGIPTYEEIEPAYRFGYGAQRHYGQQFIIWNSELETRLEEDWRLTHPGEPNVWIHSRPIIRRGWEHERPGKGLQLN